MYLEENYFDKSKELLGCSNDFTNLHDVNQFYRISRLFKDKNQFVEAEKYFKKAILWAEGEDNKALLGASYFHLCEMAFSRKKYKEAFDFILSCLSYIPEHKKAKEYLIKIFKRLSKYKVVLWGTGAATIDAIEHLQNITSILCSIDNNSELWGKKKNGIDVVPPNELVNLKPDILLICSLYASEIQKQISNMNLKIKPIIINW